jgi:hypothetical protein
MGYEGDSLLDLVTPVEAGIREAGMAMAEDLRDLGKDYIQQNTPVETSKLRGSYKTTPVTTIIEMQIGRVWQGLVYTTVDYAPHVEYGTGLWGPEHKKYKIEPKKPGGVLAFRPYLRDGGKVVLSDGGFGSPTTGPMVYRNFVMHPGSPGQAMFRLGAARAEYAKERWSDRGLRLFENSINKKVKSGGNKVIV